MKIISTNKRAGLVDHDGKAFPPFTLVDVREGHGTRILARSAWVKTEGDFLHLLDNAPEKSVRQMCKNAGVACGGDREALKGRLVEFANAAPDERPEPEQAKDLDEYGEAEVAPVKKDDSEKAGHSDAEAELREELELKNVKELQELSGELGLTKYGINKAELIDQLVEAMR